MARRSAKDMVFGSDSFLDVIANLVGIVLIIIVMVGARIRELPTVRIQETEKQETATAGAKTAEEETAERDLAARQREMVELQDRLLATLTRIETARKERDRLTHERELLACQEGKARETVALARESLAAEAKGVAKEEADQRTLRERIRELERSIQELESRPPERRQLRYYLPVSRPVGLQELLFECKDSRVTYTEVPALLEFVTQRLSDVGNQLRNRWEVTDTVGPVGAFRMKYTIARDRSSPLDGLGDLPPADGFRFAYGLARWELIPTWSDRGEPAEAALAEGSRFRRIIDAVDPETVALTFFVYPESFGLFRTLREHLYERGFIVAGRPLPVGTPMAGSRSGTVSRGQ